MNSVQFISIKPYCVEVQINFWGSLGPLALSLFDLRRTLSGFVHCLLCLLGFRFIDWVTNLKMFNNYKIGFMNADMVES